jgi:hypothetical protein
MPAVMDRRYRSRGATIPEDRRTGCPPSVLSCTAWGFSCLANCFASGELLPRLFTLTCTSFPKNRRCLFCDTFRQPRLAPGPPACFTRHAAVWCSDFPLANPATAGLTSDHLPSLTLYAGGVALSTGRDAFPKHPTSNWDGTSPERVGRVGNASLPAWFAIDFAH